MRLPDSVTRGLNGDFARRVSVSSAVLGIVIVAFLSSVGYPEWALGFGAGAGLSLFSFEVLRLLFRAFLRTPEEKESGPIPFWKKVLLGALAIAKLPIWTVVLFVAIYSPLYNVYGLVAGIALTQVVMVLKVLSLMIVPGEVNGGNGSADSPEADTSRNTIPQ